MKPQMVEARSAPEGVAVALESMTTAEGLPFVTIVVPCRNEEKHIARCLESILANDYPKERMEILILDGMSEDRTREIVAGYGQRQSPASCLRSSHLESVSPSAPSDSHSPG